MNPTELAESIAQSPSTTLVLTLVCGTDYIFNGPSNRSTIGLLTAITVMCNYMSSGHLLGWFISMPSRVCDSLNFFKGSSQPTNRDYNHPISSTL